MARGRGIVVPASDDTEEDTYSPVAKHHRREPPHPPAPRRRLLPARGWIGFFLLLNIFAIVGFIFMSAWYFPSTSTTGMVEQAIKQGDMSLLELSPRNDDGDAHTNEPPRDRDKENSGTTSITPTDPPTLAPPVESPTPTQSLLEPTLQVTPRFRADETSQVKPNEAAKGDLDTTQPPAVEFKQPVASEGDHHVTSEVPSRTFALPVTGEPVETSSPNDSQVEFVQSAETTALPQLTPETTPAVSSVQSKSLEEVLREMKGMNNSPIAPPRDETKPEVTLVKKQAQEQHQPEDVNTKSLVPLNDEDKEKQQEPRTGPALPSDDEGLENNMVAWLKADEGVEVENAAECAALGTACEVTAWKSVARALESVVFHPVNSRMRPVLQPSSLNELPLVAFSCGMAHTSGLVLHDTMTLFFVLSASQIELGDTYNGQKFFGNAPYGQFLLHGGKAAFFTAAGLVESSFVASNDQLLLVTYRLQRHAVEIKVNGLEWSPPPIEGNTTFLVRMSGNAALSLGNVKSVCDSNAFQGRMAEVLVYDAVLSDRRVDAIEHYLRLKWWKEKLPENTEQATEKEPIGDGVEPTEAVTEPSNSVVTKTTSDALELVGSPKQQETEALRPEETQLQVPQPETNPRAFNPEGVFEWLPSAELLALIAKEKGSDPTPLVDKWKQAVGEKVALVRNFQLGGEILRSFIRERRDELLTLRDEMFGS